MKYNKKMLTTLILLFVTAVLVLSALKISDSVKNKQIASKPSENLELTPESTSKSNSAEVISAPEKTSTSVQSPAETPVPSPTEEVTPDPKALFSSQSIEVGDDVYNRIYGKSYVDNSDIALSDLRYLTISYYDFNHEIQVGELIVNKAIEEDTIAVFAELFEKEYEICSMRLIDDFWTGDGATSDTASCEANNSSAFCYRVITGGKSLSNHALGMAIDINPVQNPYVSYKSGEAWWSDPNATDYIDRTWGDPHMIVEGDVCYNAFINHGFSWGGSWSSIKDYQHFER
ncbi:MAG: M15 family metallopeptidase [Pseudobutyrivibrio sp.]|nr:M15 family metallopeptidase [Pseudobutyrivibrio sp.]